MMDFPLNDYIALRAFLPLIKSEDALDEASSCWIADSRGRATLIHAIEAMLLLTEDCFPNRFPIPFGEEAQIQPLRRT